MHTSTKQSTGTGQAPRVMADTARSAPPRATAPSEVTPQGADVDGADDEAVARIVAAGPAGTLAVAGTAIGLVLAIWFAFYFLVFLPRGPVG
jgi:hypothetical protein